MAGGILQAPRFFFLMYCFYLFVAVLGLPFCAQAFSSCGALASGCGGLPRCAHRLQAWASLAVHVGSATVVHEFSCFPACGVFPDQGCNLCPLHWQTDS